MKNIYNMRPTKYRAIWISDVHLGFRGCHAETLLEFLKTTESEYLYLVGDIVDVWNMKKGLYWPQQHNNVLRTILGKSKFGTKVIYIPGNHDEIFRDYTNLTFGNIEVQQEAIHTTATGKKILILHGDQFDNAVVCNKLLTIIGDKAYDFLLYISNNLIIVRKKLGFPHWSLATYIKHKIRNALTYIAKFEEVVVHEARKRKMDGVVCGHIHHPNMRTINGIQYCNTGDWVENCTAIVEHPNGQLNLMRWYEQERNESIGSELPAANEIPS